MIKFIALRENDCSTLELYLSKMASKGWMLKNINLRYFFKFEKCEPKDIKFCVDIFDGPFKSDPQSRVSVPEYLEMCKASGWTKIDETHKYQVFYNDDGNFTPIQTDDELKLKPIFKKTLLFTIIFFLFFFRPALLSSLLNLDISTMFTDYDTLLEALMTVFFPAGLFVYILGWCTENIIWIIRAKKSLRNNTEIRYPSILSLRIRSGLKATILLSLFSVFIVLFASVFSVLHFYIAAVLDLILPIILCILSIILIIEVIRENIVPIDKINK